MPTATSPYTTTLLTIRDQTCQWFGGPKDPATRTYRTPQVPGLGVVRSARPKSDNDTDYYVGAPSAGSILGSQMLVHVTGGRESREAIAGAYGLKAMVATLSLDIYMRSIAEFAEDAQDAFFGLLEGIRDRIREDRALGSGGWENGGFNVGEANTQGIRWQMRPAQTVSELTTAYCQLSFDATYFDIG